MMCSYSIVSWDSEMITYVKVSAKRASAHGNSPKHEYGTSVIKYTIVMSLKKLCKPFWKLNSM